MHRAVHRDDDAARHPCTDVKVLCTEVKVLCTEVKVPCTEVEVPCTEVKVLKSAKITPDHIKVLKIT